MKTDVDAAQGAFDSAHGRREDMYTSYAQVRDADPVTAIVSEDMSPTQVQHLRARRMRVDETILTQGSRPDFSLKSRSYASEVEENSRKPLSVRSVQAEIKRAQQEQKPTSDDATQKINHRGITPGF